MRNRTQAALLASKARIFTPLRAAAGWRRGARGRDPGCGRGWSRSAPRATPMRLPRAIVAGPRRDGAGARPRLRRRGRAPRAADRAAARGASGRAATSLGCSSAGGFAFGGYRDDRVVAIAFPAAAFRAEAVWLRDLRQHMALDWIRALRRLAAGFGAEAPGWSRFGLLMIDGLCRREELVARDGRRGARRPAGRSAARPATGCASGARTSRSTARAIPRARSSASSPAPFRSRR